MNVEITNFAKRHFRKNFSGTKILDLEPDEFMVVVNKELTRSQSEVKILDGYADFCKLLVLKNFTAAKTGTMKITADNFHLLRTGYSSRTDEELQVLSRWFEVPSIYVPRADYLVMVLYSREQLLKEFHKNRERSPFELTTDCDYGVVAILGQTHDGEEPMSPMTMVRNHLGEAYGGSGVELNVTAHQASVDFWSHHANVK